MFPLQQYAEMMSTLVPSRSSTAMPIVSKLFIEVNLSFHMRSDSLIAMIATPSPGAFLVKGKSIVCAAFNDIKIHCSEFSLCAEKAPGVPLEDAKGLNHFDRSFSAVWKRHCYLLWYICMNDLKTTVGLDEI